MTVKIAVLDDMNILVGYKDVKKVKAGDVMVPENVDLPTDGKYAWHETDKTFVPIPPVVPSAFRCPVADHEVMVILLRAMKNPPPKVLVWLDFYRRRVELPQARKDNQAQEDIQS